MINRKKTSAPFFGNTIPSKYQAINKKYQILPEFASNLFSFRYQKVRLMCLVNSWLKVVQKLAESCPSIVQHISTEMFTERLAVRAVKFSVGPFRT